MATHPETETDIAEIDAELWRGRRNLPDLRKGYAALRRHHRHDAVAVAAGSEDAVSSTGIPRTPPVLEAPRSPKVGTRARRAPAAAASDERITPNTNNLVLAGKKPGRLFPQDDRVGI